ncbi:hypothetical protein SteCoe_34123 [Stentor coeruleus]|uniref:Uncharacterized protein n=1 Tax=Stentor coeruleus TaxID=5963 RepID=A0A1R2AVF4_9CILI|nr:hypothetical protein SteCoe_34123 [Stentor coeruleus]
MKENINSNNSANKSMRNHIRNKLFTEQKVNSAFKIVIPDVEVMICYETLALSELEKNLVKLGKEYKNSRKLREQH